MKRIFQTTLLIACVLVISGMQSFAQNPYAKVTVYTNSQQYVYGTLELRETSQNQLIWSMNFHFESNEGQTVDGGYMYQGWFLLAYSIPNNSNYYKLVATAYGVSVSSPSYEGEKWPFYLTTLPAIDFRSQGGQ
jgi:hypothetical protein